MAGEVLEGEAGEGHVRPSSECYPYRATAANLEEPSNSDPFGKVELNNVPLKEPTARPQLSDLSRFQACYI